MDPITPDIPALLGSLEIPDLKRLLFFSFTNCSCLYWVYRSVRSQERYQRSKAPSVTLMYFSSLVKYLRVRTDDALRFCRRWIPPQIFENIYSGFVHRLVVPQNESISFLVLSRVESPGRLIGNLGPVVYLCEYQYMWTIVEEDSTSWTGSPITGSNSSSQYHYDRHSLHLHTLPAALENLKVWMTSCALIIMW